MADFQKAFEKTLENEGGYSNHPADRGGETYKGIARTRHPSWSGWSIIDTLKGHCTGNELEKRLADAADIQEKVEAFYRAEFWDLLRGDEIPDQAIAEKVFDLAVNIGPVPATRYLQEALNLLNRNRGDYPDISIDGSLGPITIETIRLFLQVEKGNPAYLLKLINIQHGMHYINIMNRAATQEVFARGWLNRIKIGGLA